MLGAVGDISLGDSYLCCGLGVRSKIERFGTRYIFENIKEILIKNDLLFGNLEGVISSYNFEKYRLESMQMRGNPESVDILKEGGFTVLSLANNHIMQFGKEAVIDTIKLLEANGIGYCGIKGESNGRSDPCIIDKEGKSFCFFAYNVRPRQYFVDDPICAEFRIEEALRDLREYRDEVDFIVVSLHWGDEFIQIPSLEQQTIAHRLVDNGVDVIFGHHPHVVQGVEDYNRGLIFYSLGNFVFDMPWFYEANRSFIAKIGIQNFQKELNYEIIPIKINRNYQPELMSSSEGDIFLQKLDLLSKRILGDRKRFNSRDYLEYYLKKLSIQTRFERKLSHKFWVANIFRFPLILIIQYAYEILKRRIRYLIVKRKIGG